MNRIIIFGGNTLGHIIPGVAVIKTLKRMYPMNYYIYIVPKKFKNLKLLNLEYIDKIIYLDDLSLSIKNEIKYFYFYFKKIQEIYKKINPTIIISFGSYIGTIGIIGGIINKKITIIHEQNKIMGLGNKLVKPYVSKVLTSFNEKNAKYVGNPTLIDNLKKVKKNKKKIVITSGTNGSLFFNTLVKDAIENPFFKDYEITFITGLNYEIKDTKFKNIYYTKYIDNLSLYLQDASYVISRGGATTLFELQKLLIKAIIIPSNNVKNNHQYYNALEFSKYFSIIKEDEFSIEKLIHEFINLNNKEIPTNIINSTNEFIRCINDVKRLY